MPAEQVALTVRDHLEKNKAAIAAAMPEGTSYERFCRVALNAIQTTPILQRCTAASLFLSCVQAFSVGLEPNGPTGEGYLVPFKDRATFMPSYKGLITLARRSGLIRAIYAEIIKEGDEYKIERGTSPCLTHVINYMKRGKIIAYYAVMADREGNRDFEVMTPEDIESIRAKSKAKDAGPWQTDYDEMAKKTVIKRLLKRAPMSIEDHSLGRAIVADHQAAMGERQVLDVEGIVIPDEPPEKASRFEKADAAAEVLK